MRNRLIVIILVLACAGAATAQTRRNAERRTPAVAPRPVAEVPSVQEGPAPTEENAAGTLGGNSPFTLIVDQNNGVMDFKFNENNEVERLVAKKGVILSSEEMTLNADQLDYDVISSRLVASGQRVVVRQGEVIATCQLFKYDPKTQESELLGTPVVYNKDRNGQVSTTRGRKIEIYQNNGRAQFRVEGGILDTGTGAGSGGASAGGAAPSVGAPRLGLGGLGGGSTAATAEVTPTPRAASNRINPAEEAEAQSSTRTSRRPAQ